MESSGYYRGKTTTNDKCITIVTQFTADVVPAVQIGNLNSDPIAIYSRREGKERKNFPRLHYANGVEKHGRSGQLFKPTVRMFKTWARNHFPSDGRVAPSFYLESLGVLVFLYGMFNSYLWHWAIFRWLRIVDFPYLRGRWRGTITNSWKQGQSPAVLEIVQTASSTRVALYALESHSESRTADFEIRADGRLGWKPHSRSPTEPDQATSL